ncbi:MAG: hypothetical protein ACYS8W_11100 [Planctomycetota bacterium]|jgi:hypothetical protein
MANKTQIIEQIRFGLGGLSGKNGYMEFEHLCRHLTRQKICSNILPSTGPVSAGGDIGKDFETYKTHLGDSEFNKSVFLDLISKNNVGFACSLEKNYRKKVKADVQSIHDKNEDVDDIYFFSSQGIQSSERNKLKIWAKDEYGIALEILDIYAISELLAEPDVFWIASQYLHIPADIYPRSKEEEEWYSDYREKWQDKEPNIISYIDFNEIKTAGREACFTDNLKPDLPLWVKKFESFRKNSSIPDLKRKANYEIAVIKLRGMGDLNGYEENLREYFSEIPNLINNDDLVDAHVLLVYCNAANHLGKVNLELAEVEMWQQQLIDVVDGFLSSENVPDREAYLLDIRGSCCFQYLSYRPPTSEDLKATYLYWKKLVDLMPNSPLFPIVTFSERLGLVANKMVGGNIFSELLDNVDVILEEKLGAGMMAEIYRDRAMGFHEQNRLVDAIKELHKAKISWLAQETYRGSALSCMFLADWYCELGLLFAAKYYSLILTLTAEHCPNLETKDLVPEGFFRLSEIDYLLGVWNGCLHFLDYAAEIYNAYGTEKERDDEPDSFTVSIFHAVNCLGFANNASKNLCNTMLDNISSAYLKSELERGLEMWTNNLGKKSKEYLRNKIQENFQNQPFSDMGKTRSYTWKQLGVTWELEWKNEFPTTCLGEQIASTLQIVLADLAETDLCLIKSHVSVQLVIDDIDKVDIRFMPSNNMRLWRIVFPMEMECSIEEFAASIMGVIFTLLEEVSLLPTEQLHNELEGAYKRGILNKIVHAKMYKDLLSYFYTPEEREHGNVSIEPDYYSNIDLTLSEHDEMKWFDKEGPTYSKEKAKEYIAVRYNSFREKFSHSLDWINKQPELITIVNNMRKEGMLDWQILNIFMNIIWNWRARQNCPDSTANSALYTQEMQKVFRGENEDSPFPPLKEFNDTSIMIQKHLNSVIAVKIWDLSLRQQVPDSKSIEEFLKIRYHHFDDDIEHEDPFPAAK